MTPRQGSTASKSSLAVFDKAANHLPKRGSKTKNGNPAPYHIVIISFFFLLKKRDGTTGACVARIGFEISCKAFPPLRGCEEDSGMNIFSIFKGF
jgi:hypothetical protein